MVTYLAQAASDGASADFGVYTRELFNQLLGVDIFVIFKLFAFWLFFIWVVFALWVAFDASNRYKNWYTALLWFIFVLPFNLIGFIGYLFMRPVVTLEEKQWTKLEGKYLMQELSNINDCPNCGTIVPSTQHFCAACGTQMNVKCHGCGSMQSIYNIHCGACGEQLQRPNKVAKHSFEKEEMEEDAKEIQRDGRGNDTFKTLVGKLKNSMSKLFSKKKNKTKKNKKAKKVSKKK